MSNYDIIKSVVISALARDICKYNAALPRLM